MQHREELHELLSHAGLAVPDGVVREALDDAWWRRLADDRLPARLEEAAIAAGRETEAERAEVWAAVPGLPARPLHWAQGIGSNSAAPDDLLIQLMDVYEGSLHGCDRTAVLDAAVAHPDPRVRSRPADTFRPKLTSDQWARLIRAETSPNRRVLWAEHACAWGAEPPGDLYDDLLADQSRAEAADLPAHHIPGLAADVDPRVRIVACTWWEDIAALPKRLLADTDDAVHTAALIARHTGIPMPARSLPRCPRPGTRSNRAVWSSSWRRSWSRTRTRRYSGRWPLTRAWARTASPDWQRTRWMRFAQRWRCAPISPRSNAPRCATTSTRNWDRTPCPGSRTCTATPSRCAGWPPRHIRSSAIAWPVPGISLRMSWSVWRGTRTGWSACFSPNRATAYRPTCCWRSGAGGTAASAIPTAPAVTTTSP